MFVDESHHILFHFQQDSSSNSFHDGDFQICILLGESGAEGGGSGIVEVCNALHLSDINDDQLAIICKRFISASTSQRCVILLTEYGTIKP